MFRHSMMTNFNSTKVQLKPMEQLSTTPNKHHSFSYAKI